ncbi:MAG TPA: hypothetical protein DGT21_09940 [Armatimonadetes bacterium]|nr:hypothetical protein [Armatimonadota bacterium]
MTHGGRHITGRRLAAGIIATGMLMLLAAQAGASLCVWRNPDSDIKELFGGGSYRTVLVNVGNKKTQIEQAIGTTLDADETQLRFWPVIKDGKRVGTMAAHLGKGDYGAIEVLVAIVEPPGGPAKIKAVKIQRDRERHREALRSSTFLGQFQGKQAASALRVGVDIQPAHPSAVRASKVVALSAKKMLVAYEKLGVANL